MYILKFLIWRLHTSCFITCHRVHLAQVTPIGWGPETFMAQYVITQRKKMGEIYSMIYSRKNFLDRISKNVTTDLKLVNCVYIYVAIATFTV